MPEKIHALEERLNDFDPHQRAEALAALFALVKQGEIALAEPAPIVNVHYHTFFSFNGYGYSPSYVAWKARREGLSVAGVVDFDVLDAANEFLEAGQRLGLRTCAGIETRVFVEAFAEQVINSPGEPGIAYYMGAGFPGGDSADPTVIEELRGIAQRRNLNVLERVNPFLHPIELDYESDVLPLTPGGNATERHLCTAYDLKAREHFGDEARTAAFWAEKLGADPGKIAEALQSPPVIQGLIRSKTMKAGGVGYVKAEGPDFPSLERVAQFALAAGAIPTFTWLDGTSEGEKEIERLLDVAMEAGTAAVNIVPDRNWNIADPEVKGIKVGHLHRFIELATERDLPIAVGTEMNAYGLPFVDNFQAPEMAPLAPVALDSAYLFYAHTRLQRHASMGYLSDWAGRQFASTREKNAFFTEMGRRIAPENPEALAGIGPEMAPPQVLDLAAKAAS